MFRILARTFTTFAIKTVSMTNPLYHQLTGYTNVPRDWKQPNDADGYDFNFIQLPAGSDTHVMETDVVIVGSGCGGGVAAKTLAEAGHRVLVLDKAYHFPASHLPMGQPEGLQHLFDNGGAYIPDSGLGATLIGSAWGGGGTVNWSVCLKPQDFVRREWADKDGLDLFMSREFDECLDRVWEFVGASASGIRHNHRARVVLDGSRKLGWAADECAQNTGGKEHYCGQCHLGCGLGEKQGPAASWLPAAGRAGAQFMEGFMAERVIFSEDGSTATGVEGLWTSRGPGGDMSAPWSERTQRRVLIKAKKVVVASGTVRSPVLLMNSGIEVSMPCAVPSQIIVVVSDLLSRIPSLVATCTSTPSTWYQPHTKKRPEAGKEA